VHIKCHVFCIESHPKEVVRDKKTAQKLGSKAKTHNLTITAFAEGAPCVISFDPTQYTDSTSQTNQLKEELVWWEKSKNLPSPAVARCRQDLNLVILAALQVLNLLVHPLHPPSPSPASLLLVVAFVRLNR